MQTRNYNTVYRLMHWTIAICMLLLLLTIYLRLTWLNRDHMAAIILDFMAGIGQTLTQDQAVLLAKKIRKPMWDWHIYLGYTLLGLYSLRMLLPLFGQMKFANPFKSGLGIKEKFQYGVYLIFYFCVAASLVTGLIIEWGPKEFKKQTEAIHELSIYYLMAFIVLHFGGILMAEFTGEKGLVSKIISGNKGRK